MAYAERRTMTGDPYYDQMGGYGYDYDYGGSGWMAFAGLMIFFTGLWNAVEGFIGLFRSAYFTGTPIVGTLLFWSCVWIAIGILEMSAAYAIFSGRSWARWFGIVLVAASALIHMASIPLYPWWSMFIVAFDALIIYGLAVHWRPTAMAAGR